MNKYFLPALALILILTACSAPQNTPPTATATMTETPTLIPSPTATLEPTQISEAQIPEGPLKDFSEKIKSEFTFQEENGRYVLVKKENSHKVFEIAFDKNGNWSRKYSFNYSKDATVFMAVNGVVSDINVKTDLDTNNSLELEFVEWKIIENGSWIRKTVVNIDPHTNKEIATNNPLYSIDELVEIIKTETERIKTANGGELPDKYAELSTDHLFELIPRSGDGIIGINGLEYKIYFKYGGGNNMKGYNRIYIPNDLNEYTTESFVYTTFYSYISIGEDAKVGYVVIEGKDERLSFFVNYPYLAMHKLSVPNPFRDN